MPGQPAWTLTEMLECNLPLCWAGGGDCKVGLAQIFRRPTYLLSPLGLYVLWKNICAAEFCFFSGGGKTEACCGRFLEQKNRQRVFF